MALVGKLNEGNFWRYYLFSLIGTMLVIAVRGFLPFNVVRCIEILINRAETGHNQ
jgi:hypothetical protein